MKMYQIAELEQLSGVRAPTLRVWERRYKFIKPRRTSTNIRLYDDQQVRKLLNVVTLLSNGYKLSKIARLNDDDMHAMVLGLRGLTNDPGVEATVFVNELVAATLGVDEAAFEQSFIRSVKRFGMVETMLKVCYPFLEKIGIMWITDDAIPVQEHFASAIIRRKLIAATDALPLSKTSKKKFLLLLPPQEWHEIGLLFADYLIRSKGMETVYLGQNVPYDQVAGMIQKANCSHVLIFFINRPIETDLVRIRSQMKLSKNVPLLYTAPAAVAGSMISEDNNHLLRSPKDLLRFLN